MTDDTISVVAAGITEELLEGNGRVTMQLGPVGGRCDHGPAVNESTMFLSPTVLERGCVLLDVLDTAYGFLQASVRAILGAASHKGVNAFNIEDTTDLFGRSVGVRDEEDIPNVVIR